jgi:hypothetical protein
MSRLDAFLSFSSFATAFTEFELLGTGMGELYLKTVVDVVGDPILGELLDAFGHLPADAARSDAFRTNIIEHEQRGPVARNIIKLWYIGTWYALPQSWVDSFRNGRVDADCIPSPFAYVEGLLWPAIGAHPPGAKPGGYGSWVTPPVIPPIPT